MIRTLACDTYSRRYDWIVALMVAVVFLSDSHVRSAFPMKSVERVTYVLEAVHHELAVAVSSAIVIVEGH